MTRIDVAGLDRPPVLPASEPASAARSRLGAAPWAVVVDGDGRPAGWVAEDRLVGDGPVGAVALPVEATVPATATLRSALAAVLQTDAGWVAVVDGERYPEVLTPGGVHAAARRSLPA